MAATAETMAVNEPGPSIADTTILSPTTLEILQNVNNDPYDDDQAELRFLLSKPTCFVIFGKPGVGKTTLARRLAQEWKCQHVNATDVIMQAIDMQTEMGLKAQEILLRGEAIPEEMAAKMIEEKINSPEVAHHGYVLDGFPSLSEDYLSIRDQLELIKNWKLKPDFILNVKMPDNDLVTRRVGQRVDPSTGNMYTKEMYDPEKPSSQNDDGKGDEEEEEEEEEDDEEALPEEEEAIHELPAEVVERLVRRPEDLASHVTDNIQTYKSNVLRILEDYMADHDQQYLVELDGNKPLNLIFKELMQRLQCFVLRPAAVPIRLQDMEEEEMPEDVETDELMRSLSNKEVISPRYRWRRSRWLRYCPVALAEGNLVQGKPEFAVSFLDKIYVLSSGEAMGKFLKNPRPYLMPPQPRPPCKLCIMGPALSGKTTLSHALAQKYGAKVLDIDELIKPRIEEERQKQIQQAKDEATDHAIIVVRTKLKEQMEAEQAVKEEQASDPEETVQETEAENVDGKKKKVPTATLR